MAAREEQHVEPAVVGAARQSERLGLARAIHDRVMQRLLGVSLVLESASDLGVVERARCGHELNRALAELRRVLGGALPAEHECSLGELLRDAAREHPALPIELDLAAEIDALEAPPVARHFVAEALRNAARHSRARRVSLGGRRQGHALELRVHNDGALRPSAPAGLGLRLLRLEAAEHGARVGAGPDGAGGWRATLSLPLL